MLQKNRPVSPKMFTNERLFTIQAFTITRVHCSNVLLLCLVQFLMHQKIHGRLGSVKHYVILNSALACGQIAPHTWHSKLNIFSIHKLVENSRSNLPTRFS